MRPARKTRRRSRRWRERFGDWRRLRGRRVQAGLTAPRQSRFSLLSHLQRDAGRDEPAEHSPPALHSAVELYQSRSTFLEVNLRVATFADQIGDQTRKVRL